MRWLLGVLLAGVLLSGCTQDPSYQVSGTFADDRTDADLDEIRTLGQEHDGDVIIAESFPEQFVIGGLSKDACEDLRATLLEKEYLQQVGACGTKEPSAY